MRLTIQKKMLLCSILPISFLGIIIVIMSLTFLKASIINQVESSLRGTASTTLAAYDQNSGSYIVAQNGDVWKGGYNISSSEKMLDAIKEKSGMEVTFIYGTTRIMTSIKDKNGDRILGSPVGAKVEEIVLKNGQEYFSKNVSVDGEMYFGYYVPVFQGQDSKEPVGMVFAGVNKNKTLYSVLGVVFYMIVIVLIIAIIGILGAGMISNSISKTLKSEIMSLEELATGNLNVQLGKKHLQRKDEVGDLSRAIEKLQSDLRSVIGGISDSTTLLIRSSDSLEQTSHQTFANMDYVMQSVDTITSGAISQAQDTKNASDNIIHMGNLIIDTRSEADLLNKTADNMLEVSDKTSVTIEELKKISEEVGSSVDIIAELTEQTNESAKTIREAAEFISEIADETNLLSLNASIEAARAGEAGRGFAVVATQISKLSEDSNQSAKTIEDIIHQLAIDSEASVKIMNEVDAIVTEQQKKLNETKEKFSDVSNGIEDSMKETQVINGQATECDSNRAVVVDVISSLSAVSQENAASTEETTASMEELNATINLLAQAAKDLKDIAESLEKDVAFFQL